MTSSMADVLGQMLEGHRFEICRLVFWDVDTANRVHGLLLSTQPGTQEEGSMQEGNRRLHISSWMSLGLAICMWTCCSRSSA